MSYQEYTVRIYADHTEWRNNKRQLHRLDGPATEWANGNKFWYQNNQRHRTDGPAIERANGDKTWYQNDQLHRLDGPALEYANGDKRWYLFGKSLSKTAFNAEIARRNTSVATPCSLDGKLFTAEDGTKYKLSLVKE